MSELMATIREAKSRHTFASMCMDAHNSGSEVRALCLIQQIRIEGWTWEQVSKFCALVFTSTSGRGPESHMSKTFLQNLDAFPYWRPIHLDGDALDFDNLAGDPAQCGDSDPVISLAHVLDVAGIFHVVDLIEKRLLQQIKSYKFWLKHLESAVTVFHREYLRKRF